MHFAQLAETEIQQVLGVSTYVDVPSQLWGEVQLKDWLLRGTLNLLQELFCVKAVEAGAKRHGIQQTRKSSSAFRCSRLKRKHPPHQTRNL